MSKKLTAELSADQLKWYETIRSDTDGVERAYRVNLNYFVNRECELSKQRDKFWGIMHEHLGTKAETHTLKIVVKAGSTHVIAELNKKAKVQK